MIFPNVIENVCKHYNNAYVLHGDKRYGSQVADIITTILNTKIYLKQLFWVVRNKLWNS